MEKWKKIAKKLLFPPIGLIVFLTVLSTVMLMAVFLNGMEESFAAYLVYVLSFYSLVVLCIFLSEILPGNYRKMKQRIYDHPLGNRYMTDAVFKVRVSLYVSLSITVAFSIFKLIVGFLYSSLWLGAVAVYYVLLSVIRFLLLRYMENKNGRQGLVEEYRRYRLSAILTMLINLTLSGIVLNMLLQDKTHLYSDVYVIASAVYTFYTLTVSIIDLVKYRKYQSPVLSAAKAIRFAAALVSILSLETAMLIQFGEDESFRRIMLSLTGAGVCLIVLGMSIYMIVRANREIKKLREKDLTSSGLQPLE